MWVWPPAGGSGTLFDKFSHGEGAIWYGNQAAGALSYICGEPRGPSRPAPPRLATSITLRSLPEPIKTDAWTHIAVVRDLEAGRIIWYRNGKKESEEKCAATSIYTTPYPVDIGFGFNVGYFKGKIDEFALYGRALLAQEVQALYNMGAHGMSLSGPGK